MGSPRLEATRAILREHGPMRAEDLGPLLAARGGTKARDPVAAARDALSDPWRFTTLADGRSMDRAAAADGAVLWHRVTDEERRQCGLRIDPDLTMLDIVTAPMWRSRWSEGRDIQVAWVEGGRLAATRASAERFLPLSYEQGRCLRDADLVAVVTVDDWYRVEADREPPGEPHAAGIAALEATACALLADHHRPVRLERLVLEALAQQPDLLRRSVEPLGDSLARLDLVTHRDLVGTPLTDWGRFEWLSGHQHARRDDRPEDWGHHDVEPAAQDDRWFDVEPEEVD